MNCLYGNCSVYLFIFPQQCSKFLSTVSQLMTPLRRFCATPQVNASVKERLGPKCHLRRKPKVLSVIIPWSFNKTAVFGAFGLRRGWEVVLLSLITLWYSMNSWQFWICCLEGQFVIGSPSPALYLNKPVYFACKVCFLFVCLFSFFKFNCL